MDSNVNSTVESSDVETPITPENESSDTTARADEALEDLDDLDDVDFDLDEVENKIAPLALAEAAVRPW